MVVLALTAIASPAFARPKRRDARAAFDRGVAAYKKGSFEAASEALSKSFELERDVDTLFAWAQSERKLEHCDKAIVLYEDLLTFEMPAANKDAVSTKLAECRAQVQATDHKAEPAPSEPVPATVPTPLAGTPTAPGSPTADRAPEPPPTDSPSATRAWYKDPIALTLIGSGLVATGAGIGFLVSAKSAHDGFATAKTYEDAQTLLDTARSRQRVGFIITGAGAALVVGGVVWIVTHRHAGEQRAVTGWLAPGGGGLAIGGAF